MELYAFLGQDRVDEDVRTRRVAARCLAIVAGTGACDTAGAGFSFSEPASKLPPLIHAPPFRSPFSSQGENCGTQSCKRAAGLDSIHGAGKPVCNL